MPADFGALLRAIEGCSQDEKQAIFSIIRNSIRLHPLEETFNVRAEVILEAIARATDLTQRGVRGIIAETIFHMEVLPNLEGWESKEVVGDLAYDAILVRDTTNVRVQVKMQRKERGVAKLRKGGFVVEVQRTRGGTKDGVKTRPYRFGEFDLIAVCMEPSTQSWTSFQYALASQLTPDPREPTVIATFQLVPAIGSDESDIWTSDLRTALGRFSKLPRK